MKYKFIGTEKDLVENGFDLSWTVKNDKIFIRDRHVMESVLVSTQTGCIWFNYAPYNRYRDIKPYIQDLIEKGLVVEVKK